MIVGTRPSDPSRGEEFNEWYDTTHVDEMCDIPGITAGRRFVLSNAQMMPPDATRHEYLAIYEFDTDDVQQMVAELGDRMANGTIHLSDVVQLDPLPNVIIYDEMAQRT
jgi:hypothetical protein